MIDSYMILQLFCHSIAQLEDNLRLVLLYPKVLTYSCRADLISFCYVKPGSGFLMCIVTSVLLLNHDTKASFGTGFY